jgi:hypothetical protein
VWNRRRRVLIPPVVAGEREKRRGPASMAVGGVRVPSRGALADRLVVAVKAL